MAKFSLFILYEVLNWVTVEPSAIELGNLVILTKEKGLMYREYAASTMALYTSKCVFMRIEARNIHIDP